MINFLIKAVMIKSKKISMFRILYIYYLGIQIVSFSKVDNLENRDDSKFTSGFFISYFQNINHIE